jgi:hypothetical protein
MPKPARLAPPKSQAPSAPVVGVCATCDPRIDEDARQRAKNIIALIAEAVSKELKLPDGQDVPVVYSDILLDSERQADAVARQFKQAQDLSLMDELTGIFGGDCQNACGRFQEFLIVISKRRTIASSQR